MRTILVILRKEFIQIFRDKSLLPILFVAPLLQLLILVNAATFEMKNINMIIVDHDMSQTSRDLISSFQASPFYNLKKFTFSIKEAENEVTRGNADVILHIRSGFEKNLLKYGRGEVQLKVDAVNATKAKLAMAYTSQIIQDFNKELTLKFQKFTGLKPFKSIELIPAYWYNPDMNYKIFMLPGILVILVTAIGSILTAINLVREKEMGTIEQINVTPIKKIHFITGKLIPFWVIALVELAFGLLLGWLLYGVPVRGSLGVLFGFASVYLFVVLSFGLLISTFSSNQQQVMFVAFFFMLLFILTSGIFTPVESMPEWAIKGNIINPVAYFMKANRMIMLKGSGFWDVSKEFFSLLIYGILAMSAAVWRYRKVS